MWAMRSVRVAGVMFQCFLCTFMALPTDFTNLISSNILLDYEKNEVYYPYLNQWDQKLKNALYVLGVNTYINTYVCV